MYRPTPQTTRAHRWRQMTLVSAGVLLARRQSTRKGQIAFVPRLFS